MYNSLKPSNIREENMKQIIKLLRTSDQLLSRADIARRVSLSAPSVSKIINILLEAGIMTEREEGRSGAAGGRKPILLDINKDCSYLMGIYIEERLLTITLANFSGEIVNTRTFSYQIGSDFDCIDFLIGKMREVLDENTVDIDRVLSIGVSVPGVFDSNEGVIKFAPNIQIWEKTPIGSELVQEFDCEVIIDNAVNMAVLG
ncbi:MAG: ROK family transcriptional regulator, partial [Halanaerobiales bacterium]